ncbi:MAG TPA: PAS domain S-box protein [Methylococcaceae bacterium]|nr:PAS domain S-box protein [Methylococcaceae bacterium]
MSLPGSVGGDFLPHGYCFAWSTVLLWVHVIADSATALSYYSIPFALLYFVRRRRDLPYRRMFVLFSLFILGCGTTHALGVWTIWHPDYWAEGLVKATTAAVSLSTAVLIWPLLPRALAMPSRTELETANRRLAEEAAARTAAERLLQETENRLEFVLESANIGVWELNPEHRAVFRSPLHDRLFGYQQPLPEWGYETFLEHVLEEDRPHVEASFRKDMENLQNVSLECRIRRADGCIRWLRIDGEHRRDAQRNSVGMAGIVEDITERREMEEALREREEIYSAIVNQAADAIVLIDAETLKFAEFNAAAHTVLGYTREEFARLSLYDIQGVFTPAEVDDKVQAMRRTHRDLHFENPHRCKDGSCRFMDISNRIIHLRGRDYFAAIWHDLTERKRSEQTLAEEAERRRLIFDTSKDGIVVLDMDGKVQEMNQSYADLLGYSLEEAHALHVWDWDVQWTREQLLERFHSKPNREETFETRQRRKDGAILDVEISANLAELDGQKLRCCVVRDISQRKATETQLRLAASVFQEAAEGIVITDADTDILDVNLAFTRLTGYGRDEVIGRKPRLLKSGHHGQEFYAELWQSVLETGYWHGEIWNRHKNGSLLAEDITISAIKDASGAISRYIALFSDITERKHHQEKIEHLAYYDALTQLPNRLLLADRMQQALALSARSNSLVAVCYLDLDGFKPVNDRYGHRAGDQVLTAVAERIQSHLRASDSAARLGGDEFVFLLTHLDSEDECNVILARIIDALSQPYALDNGAAVAVSASVGVSLYPRDDSDPDLLLRHADQAMYLAKQTGRNRVQWFDPRRIA